MQMSKYLINEYIDTNTNYLIDTENYLKSVCEEYNFDYDKLDEESDTEISNEGFFGSAWEMLKRFFNQAIKFIISLWKKLVEMAKKIAAMGINFLKDILKKFSNKKVLTEEVSVKTVAFCQPNTDIKSDRVEYKSFDDLKNNFNKVINIISKEINIESKKNIDSLRKYEANFNKKASNLESATTLLEKVIYNDANLEIDDREIKSLAYSIINNTISMQDTVIQNTDIFTTMNTEDLNSMNIELLKNLNNESRFLYDSYQIFKLQYINEYIKKFYNNEKTIINYSFIKKYSVLNQVINNIDRSIAALNINKNISIQELTQAISSLIFPDFEDTPEGERKIKEYINLKINWSQGIINSLSSMLSHNAEIFNITKDDYEKILKQMNSGDFSEISKRLQPIIYDNFDPEYNVLDMRKFGLGTFVMSDQILMHNDIDLFMRSDKDVHNAGITYIDPTISHRILIYLTKYDCTIISHGSVVQSTLFDLYQDSRIMSNDQLNMFKKYYSRMVDKFKELYNIDIYHCSSSEFKQKVKNYKYTNKVFLNRKDYEKDYELPKNRDGLKNRFMAFNEDKALLRWNMNPIYTPDKKGPFTDVELYLYQLREDGYKRVLVLNCNPGAIGLSDDLIKDKRFLVRMSTRSTLM